MASYTGVIQKIEGVSFVMAGTHKLMDGEKRICLLTSRKLNLDDYLNCRVGFLTGRAGSLVIPQSGLAQTPYSIRKAEPTAEGSAGKTATFKAGKLKMVGWPQGRISEKPALKARKFVPEAEKNLSSLLSF